MQPLGTSPASAPSFWDVISRSPWLLVLGSVLGLCVGAWRYAQQPPPYYQASALVRIQPGLSLWAPARADLRRYARPVRRQIRRLARFHRSGKGMKNLAHRLRVAPAFGELLVARLHAWDEADRADLLQALRLAEDLPPDTLARRLRRRIRLRYDAEAGALEVQGRAPQPEATLRLAQLGLEAVHTYALAHAGASNTATRHALEKLVAEQTESLQLLLAAGTDLGREAQPPQAFLARLTSLEAAQRDLALALAQHRARLDAFTANRAVATLSLAPTRPLEGALRTLETDLATARLRLRLLDADHPARPRLQEDIAALSAERETQVAAYLAAAARSTSRVTSSRELLAERLALIRLEAQQALVQQELAQYRERLPQVMQQHQDLRRLARQHRVLQKTYAEHQFALARARLEEEKEIVFFDLVQPVGAPAWVAPQRSRFELLGYGWLAGLLLGVGLAYLRAHLDTRLHDPADLTRQGLVPLAAIPRLAPTSASSMPVTQGTLAAFRSLHTRLRFASPDAPLRILTVTGPTPGVGASTTAQHLAALFAEAGQRVLLVDADLRHPQLHRRYQQPRAPGLTDVLRGNATLATAAYPTDLAHLSLLPAGEATATPTNWLGGRDMEAWLITAGKAFDLILLDAPPVLSTPEAAQLAALSDGVLLVTAAHHTEAAALRRTLAALGTVRASILGGVLNRFDPAQARRRSFRRPVAVAP